MRADPKGQSIEVNVNKATLKKFKTLLTDKRDEILKKAKQTLEQDMALDTDDLPDEMDLASSEYLQSFTFRLRGREKSFLDKIEKALKKIEDGSFGICEECGEEISVKRLEARPETTLCIRCKEDQERMEKDYTWEARRWSAGWRRADVDRLSCGRTWVTARSPRSPRWRSRHRWLSTGPWAKFVPGASLAPSGWPGLSLGWGPTTWRTP